MIASFDPDNDTCTISLSSPITIQPTANDNQLIPREIDPLFNILRPEIARFFVANSLIFKNAHLGNPPGANNEMVINIESIDNDEPDINEEAMIHEPPTINEEPMIHEPPTNSEESIIGDSPVALESASDRNSTTRENTPENMTVEGE